MSISIRHQMQLDGYKSNHHSIYPLTIENVSKVTLADPSSMPLARFCKEIESTAYITSSVTSLHHHQQQSRGTDSVMESPRILPFPYHNDSYFLPTAEHDYPGYSTTDTSSLSSSRVGSRQFMTSLTSVNNRIGGGGLSRLQASRSPSQESYNSNNNNNNNNNNEKRYTAERTLPSSPIRHYHHPINNNNNSNNNITSFEDWKKEYVQDQKSFMLKLKHRICLIKNNIGSNDSSTFLKSKKYYRGDSDQTSTKSTSPWYKKIWCMVSTPQIKRKSSMMTLIDEKKKKNTKKQMPSQFDTGIRRSASLSCTPVWYSQFRCNPPHPPTNSVLLS